MTIVTLMVMLVRRVFGIAVVGSAGFAAWSAWRRYNSSATALPPEWPPIEPPSSSPPADDPARLVTDELVTDELVTDALVTDALVTDELVTDLVATPPSEGSPTSALTWVAPDGGACPSSHPIKANSNSGIFHVQGGRFYNQTRAERCYSLAEDAEADGYRRAKN